MMMLMTTTMIVVMSVWGIANKRINLNHKTNDDDKFDYYNDSGIIHGTDIDNDDNY